MSNEQMSALCVHCDRDKPYHRLAAAVPDQFLACPVYVDGDFTGWHPVNRFTPRAAKNLLCWDCAGEDGWRNASGGTQGACQRCGKETYLRELSPATVQPQPQGGFGDVTDSTSETKATVAELERERDGWRIGNDCLERERDALKRERDEALKTAQHTARNYDDLNYRFSAVRTERDDLKATLDKIAGIKGTPVVLALLKERDDLQAKLATIERHMAVCRATAGVPDDETLAVWVGEMKAKCEALEKERDATWDALMEVETTFPEPWFSVGTPSDFAKHIKKRVENLKAKCEALERDYSALMTSLNAASKFACDMEKSQAARIEVLEKALREWLDATDAQDFERARTAKAAANAALAGKENS